MNIEVIGANLKFKAETAAELLQLKDLAAKIEHGSFANARKYQWELESVTIPLIHNDVLNDHARQMMAQASEHIHIHLD